MSILVEEVSLIPTLGSSDRHFGASTFLVSLILRIFLFDILLLGDFIIALLRFSLVGGGGDGKKLELGDGEVLLKKKLDLVVLIL